MGEPLNSPKSSSSQSSADDWKLHVLECPFCGRAKGEEGLCPIGRNLWRTNASVPQTKVPPAYVPPAPITALQIAERVTQSITSRAVVQASSGVSIVVPMEKTSRAIEFSTAPGVVLRMPERDIEIYSAMKEAVRRLAIFAEAVARFGQVVDATESDMRESGETVSERDKSLVLASVGTKFGVPPNEIYNALCNLQGSMLGLGDRIGQFMRVDDDTRRVIRNVRVLAMEMRGAAESCPNGEATGRLPLRILARQARLCALDLQSEIERRLGT